MNDKLILNLNGEVIEVTQDDNNRYSLNDLFRASGSLESKKPYRFLNDKKQKITVVSVEEQKGEESLTFNTEGRNIDHSDAEENSGISCSLPEDFDSYVVRVGKGRGSVTYAPLTIVYKYAAFISKEFEDAVYKAFTELSKGNTLKAAMIAESVAIPPELIQKESDSRKVLASTIKEFVPNASHYTYSNYNDLVNKAATGFRTKELTDGSMSSAKWAIKQGQPEVIQAQIACIQLVIAGLTLGSDYHSIAAMLQVKTSKNEKQLKNIVSRISV